MSRPIFEVIALGAGDAAAAQAGGADRLELVADMAADGLSPAPDVFAAVRAAVDIPVRVMLRMTDGFLAGDMDALCLAADALRTEGAEEFVLGFLDRHGAMDLAAVRTLVGAMGDAPWTLHRAIDHAADRDSVLRAVTGFPGLDTYLTAGSPKGVDAGLPVLLAEAARPAPPRLMAGGGLRRDHLPALLAAGVNAFHVGSAVRPASWAGPVDPAAVREWRDLLDTAVPAS